MKSSNDMKSFYLQLACFVFYLAFERVNYPCFIYSRVFTDEAVIYISITGDFFKIGSWLIGYLMVAKVMTKTYIATEIIFATSYVVLSYYFMNHYGIIGATYSFLSIMACTGY